MQTRTWSLLRDGRAVWIVGVIVLLLFVATNLPWQLDDYDQAKQAFTSFEMVKQGHWFYQHTPRQHIATKPPLIGWISAGLFEMTRSWDLAWRLPSFVASVALSLCLLRSAISAYGTEAGLIAFSAFTLNLLTPRLATLVRTDMPLTLVIALVGILIWRKVRLNESWNSRDRLWMFVLLTAGMLIKGPIIYAFILPGILLFQWWRRKAGAPSAWCGWWPWIASLAIFLLWVLAGIRFVPGFYEQVVVQEFLGRFGETMHRPQPWYFYLPHVLHKFAPWSVLSIALAALAWQTDDRAGGKWFRRMSPDVIWLLFWSLGGLVLMSCIPSKRVDRIFPILPPLCLLLAAQVRRLVQPNDNDSGRRLQPWLMGVLGFAIVFTGGYTALKMIGGYRGRRAALVDFGRAVRREANTQGWRYEAIAGSDEGMILYLDKPDFIEPRRAIADWNAGNLDALVVPADGAANYIRDLKGAPAERLKSAQRRDLPGTYVLFVRQGD
jgi:4-amino-4-deoxy-L-arabinose transferase-like glycosyltransferase